MNLRTDHSALEPAVQEIGHELYCRASRASRRCSIPAACGKHSIRPSATRDRSAPFQFVDVLPQLGDSHDIARHFSAYLKRHRLAGPGPAVCFATTAAARR